MTTDGRANGRRETNFRMHISEKRKSKKVFSLSNSDIKNNYSQRKIMIFHENVCIWERLKKVPKEKNKDPHAFIRKQEVEDSFLFTQTQTRSKYCQRTILTFIQVVCTCQRLTVIWEKNRVPHANIHLKRGSRNHPSHRSFRTLA